MLAVGLDGYDAARAAVALHGTAGQALADAEGWFTADRLPEALARISLACRTGAAEV
jgi:NAD(P)H-hydrate repair Nnr-like enzyme with NAD(P)H-hydrate dehydratase domain